MIRTGILKEDAKPPDNYYPVYISSKMTLQNVKEIICKKLDVQDHNSTQMWMNNEVINKSKVLQTLVE